jgi:hypothetical protein
MRRRRPEGRPQQGPPSGAGAACMHACAPGAAASRRRCVYVCVHVSACVCPGRRSDRIGGPPDSVLCNVLVGARARLIQCQPLVGRPGSAWSSSQHDTGAHSTYTHTHTHKCRSTGLGRGRPGGGASLGNVAVVVVQACVVVFRAAPWRPSMAPVSGTDAATTPTTIVVATLARTPK